MCQGSKINFWVFTIVQLSLILVIWEFAHSTQEVPVDFYFIFPIGFYHSLVSKIEETFFGIAFLVFTLGPYTLPGSCVMIMFPTRAIDSLWGWQINNFCWFNKLICCIPIDILDSCKPSSNQNSLYCKAIFSLFSLRSISTLFW